MPQPLAESRATLIAEATGTAGRYAVQLIDAGWGSSGYYSLQVLAEAAANRVFPAGLHMYADHPHGDGSGLDGRGNRSVRDLWAVLESDATLTDSGALVAEIRVFSPYRPLIDDMRDDIGLSIRAVGMSEAGEIGGRRGQIITSIDEASSVDFVSAAGRGGRILQLIESAQGEGLTEHVARQQLAEARNVGQWIESRLHLNLTQIADEMFGDGRLTREERISLSSAVGDGLQAFTTSLEASQPQLYTRDIWTEAPGPDALAESTVNDIRDALDTAVTEQYRVADTTWAWVRDFDPDASLVYFDLSGDDTGTFSQTYTLGSDGQAELTGERTEVSVRTTYVPVDPAGQSNPTESEEDTMPQIEEARLRQLEADAGRVQALEAERTAADQRAEAAERQLAESNARTAARPLVTEVFAGHELPAQVFTRVTEAVIATAPLTATGALDEAALRTSATAARTQAEAEVAAIAEALGAGRPRGFGSSAPAAGSRPQVDMKAVDAARDAAFGRGEVA